MAIGAYKNIPVQTKKFVHIAIENLDPVNPWAVRWDFHNIKFFSVSFLKDIFKYKIEGKKVSEFKHFRTQNLDFYFD